MAEEKKNPSVEKLKALQLAMEKIDKQFGKGAIMKLGDIHHPPLYCTAILPIQEETLNELSLYKTILSTPILQSSLSLSNTLYIECCDD